MKPKEEKIFELLRQHTDLCAEAGHVCFRALSGEISSEEGYKQIQMLKKEERTAVLRVREKTYKTFHNPAEREDVRILADKLDFAINKMKEVMNCLCMYLAEKPPRGIETLMELADSALTEIKKMADYTVDIKENYLKMEARCQKILSYEERGDLCYREEMSRFFRENKDPLYIIRWKDIMTGIEEILDASAGIVPVFQKISTRYI